MKSYTDLDQSRKLTEILPLESADMHYWWENLKLGVGHSKELQEGFESRGIDYTPCWSLAALLSVIPSVIKRNGKRMFLTLEKAGAYNLYYKSPDRLDELWETKEEPIDACVAMIIKLYELNWL